MADPFEVRMRFTNQLTHLNASTSSATKAANYALKHSEFADDLHSCILEQLERQNMNVRANIMYFLPALAETANTAGDPAYVRMMERDVLRIIDLVAPDDGSGAANVKVVRKVLQQLQTRGFLQKQTVLELEECILGRDNALLPTSPGHEEEMGTEQQEGTASISRTTPRSAARDPYGPPPVKLDKRQIEQRIEEDRERHKRAREGIWAVQQKSALALADDTEIEKMWDEDSGVDDDDLELCREDAEARRVGLEFEDT